MYYTLTTDCLCLFAVCLIQETHLFEVHCTSQNLVRDLYLEYL